MKWPKKRQFYHRHTFKKLLFKCILKIIACLLKFRIKWASKSRSFRVSSHQNPKVLWLIVSIKGHSVPKYLYMQNAVIHDWLIVFQHAWNRVLNGLFWIIVFTYVIQKQHHCLGCSSRQIIRISRRIKRSKHHQRLTQLIHVYSQFCSLAILTSLYSPWDPYKLCCK